MSAKKFDKKLIIPIIHFILSFFWERLVLMPKDAARVAFSIPLNDTFSLGFEQAMCYVISKIMAGIAIFLLWKLVFSILGKKIHLETTIVFGIIWIVFLGITVIMWPDVFEAGGDNFIPYSYAVRLVPEYWHSIYLSCLYSASVMVFPHAIAINILQMTVYVAAVGYLYNRIRVSDAFGGARCCRFLCLLMFFFRDTFMVATNPERAEYNASFTLIFISIILIDMLEKKVRSGRELAGLLIFAAFLAVFRSEGIVVALLGFIALFAGLYRPGYIKGALVIIALAVMFFVFKLPIKVGEIKYYGSDYSIINSFNSLHNIFCSDKADLKYSGAEADLAAIEAVTPVELIKEFSSEGYRRFNYSRGHVDINQSMIDKETAESYQKAYRRIVLHNLPIYLKTQWSMLLQASGAGVKAYSEPYTGDGTGMPEFGMELWEVGRADFMVIPGRYTWERNNLRNKMVKAFTIPRFKYIDFLTNTRLYTGFLALEFIFGIFMIIKAIVGLFKKRYDNLATGVVSLILEGYVVLLALLMPVGANMYFHAFIYGMFATIIVFLRKRI